MFAWLRERWISSYCFIAQAMQAFSLTQLSIAYIGISILLLLPSKSVSIIEQKEILCLRLLLPEDDRNGLCSYSPSSCSCQNAWPYQNNICIIDQFLFNQQSKAKGGGDSLFKYCAFHQDISQIDQQSIKKGHMTLKLLALALILALCVCRSYPTYKQCDSKWGNDQLGTSSNTICKAGCLMSSVAMALSGCGKSYNPGTLNTWLKGHGGYVSGDLFVWGSVNSLGLSYIGKVANSNIQAELNKNSIVILNVHNGGHWVLATSMSGSTIQVNDPGYSTTSYTLSQIVANNSGLYHFVGSPILGIMIWELEYVLNVNGKREKLMHADGGLLQQ